MPKKPAVATAKKTVKRQAPAGTTLPIVQLSGAAAGTVEVGKDFFGAPVNVALLHQLTHAYRASARAGTADTKRRSEVSGGGKKPWKQKHTGRARAGSTRSPLWRHGGIIFGPHPRDFSIKVPAQMRRAGLLEALRAKARDGELTIVDALQAEKPSTKQFASTKLFQDMECSTLVVLEQHSQPVTLSLRNLCGVELSTADTVTAFDLLNHRRVLLTKAAWTKLEARLQEPARG